MSAEDERMLIGCSESAVNGFSGSKTLLSVKLFSFCSERNMAPIYHKYDEIVVVVVVPPVVFIVPDLAHPTTVISSENIGQ